MTEADKGQVPARANRSIESLKVEAYGLLKEFQTAASAEEATEEQRVNAETAKILVEIAEMKARLIDVNTVTSKTSELEKYWEQLTKTLEEDLKAAMSMVGQGSEQASIAALVSQAVNQVEAKRKELDTFGDQHAWKAWNQVCDELLALRAGLDITSKQGEA